MILKDQLLKFKEKKLMDYWRESLKETPILLDLPTDHQRPEKPSGNRKTQSFVIDGTVLKSIKEFCEKEDTEIYIVLFAILNILLYRYTEGNDIVVGALLPNQEESHQELNLKELNNYQIIKNCISGELQFLELINKINEKIDEVKDYQGLSHEEIFEILEINEEINYHPLFQVTFEYCNQEKCYHQLNNRNFGKSIWKDVDLKLAFIEENKQISGTIEYNTDLYQGDSIERMMGHFLTLLQSALENPCCKAGDLTLLTEEEREVIFNQWNGRKQNYNSEKLLHKIFEEQVEKTPNQIAYIYKNQSITYRQLNRSANRLAHRLKKLGVGPEVAVGVFMERSIKTALSLLAILKAGGAYIPLDLTYPSAHIDYILEENNVPVLLTQQELLDQLPKNNANIICVDEEMSQLPDESWENPINEATASNLAIIMYTSGSTGKPKGVAHEQHQLMNRFTWLWEEYPFSGEEMACQRTNVNFIPSLWGFLGGLLKGVTTTILSDLEIKDPMKLVETLYKKKVTRLVVVPSLLRAILNSDIDLNKYLSNLKVCIVCGEPLTVDLYNDFKSKIPWSIFVNDYGATEVNGVLYYDSRWQTGELTNVPIGRNIPNVLTYILDSRQQPVPIGVAGELFVSGICLSRGYVNKPEMTAERYIKNPFSKGENRYMYKMGDLAKYLLDGSIQCIGRKDNQVKIRGIRIELNGIEASMITHPDVKECVVAKREKKSGATDLVAYYVSEKRDESLSSDIRNYLKTRLLEYMLPSLILQIDSIPRTPNGKVDRKSLPDPIALSKLNEEREKAEIKGGVTLNIKDIELKMKKILSEVMESYLSKGYEKETFLDLGLDSIGAVEFIKELNKEFEVGMSVTALYDHPTPADLITQINQKLKEKTASEINISSTEEEKEKNSKEKNKDQDKDIAVIGISGKFPGAENPYEFWELLKNRVDCVDEFPKERWEADKYYDPTGVKGNTAVTKWGALMKDVDKFHPSFFKISPKEAELMNPQQRLCLQECYRAFEDAGYSPKDLDNQPVGVFIGARQGDYLENNRETKVNPNYHALMGTDSAILASRISYYLNLKGPAMSIDTACSSSLVSLHLACKSIQDGDCGMALAGGVFVLTSPSFLVMSSNMGMLSTEGRCKAFDNEANGFGIGEGVGVVLLKPLKKALEDGDYIYGVIKGSGINQDGKTNGITAPSKEAQKQLQMEVYKNHNINPESISYVEAHGTGTKLGDPIEIEALTESFGTFTSKKQYCGIGSVKTNVGHTITAAGITGFIKLLLCLDHKKLVPTLNFNEKNEHIDFENSPFYVNTEYKDWQQTTGYPRRGAISSFGFSGTNGHVVVEEAPVIKKADIDGKDVNEIRNDHLIVLSAQDEEGLQQKMRDLEKWLKEYDNGHFLEDISYTLLMGRSHFEYRWATVVKDKRELMQQLKEIKDGVADTTLQKEVKDFNSIVFNREGMENLSNLYISGGDFDWQLLFVDKKYYKVPLPTYPFRRESYWIKEVNLYHLSNENTTMKKLHPLVDNNISNFMEQSFNLKLTGEEYFLKDHVINGKMILPGMVQMENAIACGQLAAGEKVKIIKDLVWTKAVMVDGEEEVLQTILYPTKEGAEFNIITQKDGQEEILHSYGNLIYEEEETEDTEETHETKEKKTINLNEIKSSASRKWEKNQCYSTFQQKGLYYGDTFSNIKNLYISEKTALAEIHLSQELEADFNNYILHPALMDSALQSVMGITEGKGETEATYVPYSVGEVKQLSLLTNRIYAYAREAASPDNASDEREFDITITNEKGNVLVEVKGLRLRPFMVQGARNTTNNGLLYYKPQWKNTEIIEGVRTNTRQTNITNGVIMVFDYDDSRYKEMKKFFKKVILVKPSYDYREKDESVYEVNPRDPQQFAKLCQRIIQSQGSLPHNILYLWTREEATKGNLENQLENNTYPIFYLSKALMETKPSDQIRLLYLYSSGNPMGQALNGAVTGFARTIRQENPLFLYKTVEVPCGGNQQSITNKIVQEFNSDFNTAIEIKYENEKRYIKELKEVAKVVNDSNNPTLLKDKGVYLISGGLGGVGYLVARHILKNYNGRVVLFGRSSLNHNKELKLKELQKFGGEVLYISADISREEDVDQLFMSTIQRFGSIHGLIHSAGVTMDSFILKKDWGKMKEVMTPKIYGTMNLYEMAKNKGVEFFLMFSSIASLFGNMGQGDYALGNSFMDHFASLEGINTSCRTIAINWPFWKDGGMKVEGDAATYVDRKLGLLAMESETGLKALEDALSLKESQLTVLYGGRNNIRNTIDKVFLTSSNKIQQEQNSESTLNQQELIQRAEGYLKKIISEETKMNINQINSKEALEKYGIESIMINNLNRILEKDFGQISKTLFFEYQNIEDLAGYFAKFHREKLVELTGNPAGNTVTNIATRESQQASDKTSKTATTLSATSVRERRRNRFAFDKKALAQEENIAIVGLSGRYPMADNMKQFWQNLKHGVDAITEIPSDRWNHDQYFESGRNKKGKTYSKWGGFIHHIDKFDPLFFNISPKEAELMDPQERIFLQTAWHTFEDAGYTKKRVDGLKTGVFVGVMFGHYQLYGAEETMKGNVVALSSSYATIANRVSYYLNLRGPSMAIDTMCSSSLTAIHLACESIKKGECQLALAGGVNLSLHPLKYIQIAQGNFASTDGRCRSFGMDGDGYVPGEGSGAVLLKPLSKAVEDGDQIYGIIKGTSINHGGKTNGYTVPNPNAQSELIVEALESAKINPRTISYIEAHGTGTSLGDPIEITGLMKAFEKYTEDKQFCSIGSVKSNIGHLESAAGVAGVSKILLQMKYGELVPSLHSKTLNPNIDFENSPFVVQQSLKKWQQPVVMEGEKSVIYPRRAAISSFGAGGSNAHVIIEEYNQKPQTVSQDVVEPQLVVLSAVNKDRLKAYCNDLIDYLSLRGRNPHQKNKEGLYEKLKIDVTEVAASILNVTPDDIGSEEDLFEMGFDPVNLTEMITILNDRFEINMNSKTFTTSPSIDIYAKYLEENFPEVLKNHYNIPVEEVGNPVGFNLADEGLTLKNIAYTLQVGREAMDERLVLLVSSVEELLEKLKDYNDCIKEIEGVYEGNIKTNKNFLKKLLRGKAGKEFIKLALQEKEIEQLAELWVLGVEIDWSHLYPENPQNRPFLVSLPGYSFGLSRYWVPEGSYTEVSHQLIPHQAQTLHTLLDSNESTLMRQAYKKTYRGDEFYLRDHKVNGEKVLPGVIYLEMARAAANLATEGGSISTLKNIVWTAPLKIADGAVDTFISLQPAENSIAFNITAGANAKLHAQGMLTVGQLPQSHEKIDINRLISRCGEVMEKDRCYDIFARTGLHYGIAFKPIEKLFVGEKDVVSIIKLPNSLQDTKKSYQLHPTLVDGALQTVIGLVEKLQPNNLNLPFAIGEIQLIRELQSQCYVYAEMMENNNGTMKFDITIMDVEGNVLVKINHFAIRSLVQNKGNGDTDLVSYRSQWKSTSWEKGRQIKGNVLIFISHENEIMDYKNSLTYADKTIFILQESSFKNISKDIYGINPNRLEDYEALMEQLNKGGIIPNEILYCWNRKGFEANVRLLEKQVDEVIYPLGHLAKALIKQKYTTNLEVLVLYPEDEKNPQPLYAAVGGFAKSLKLENPKINFKTVGMDEYSIENILEKSAYEFSSPNGVFEVKYGNNQRYIKVLEEIGLAGTGEKITRTNGTYLITGGAGGLGLKFAEYLTQQDQVNLVLIGRSPLSSDKEKAMEVLRQKGSQVTYIAADISKEEDVKKLIATTKSKYGAINGVIHSAGVIKDSYMISKKYEDFKAVISPKIYGTMLLDQETRQEPLDFFVLFSSIAAAIGNVGQCDYAFGNCFMDNYALKRRNEGGGGKTISINWPLWREGGMRIDEQSEKLLFNTIGMKPLSTEKGLSAFEAILVGENTQVTVVEGDAERLRANIFGKPVEKTAPVAPSSSSKIPQQKVSTTKIKESKAINVSEKLFIDLKETVGEVLKINLEDIDLEAQMSDFGFDSVLLTEFSNSLNDQFGLFITPNIFFEHSTLESFGEYMLQEYNEKLQQYYRSNDIEKSVVETAIEEAPMEEQTMVQQVVTQPVIQQPIVSRLAVQIPQHQIQQEQQITNDQIPQNNLPQEKEPIAIVGISGVMPQSKNLEEFWNNIVAGKDLIQEVPKDRWDWEAVYGNPLKESNKTNIKWGGFIDDVDKFDPLFFGISPTEAELMDPQQRLFMETVWKAIEDAGSRASELSGTKTGLFVGVATQDYTELLRTNHVEVKAQTATGMSHCILANRISYLLNLTGPSESIDTACSSSLVAIHKAVNSIQSGECEMAIVGGINLMLSPTFFISFNKAGMLCEDGRCKTFDKRANGYVRGEGVGALMLKPLSKAKEDGDYIYALVKGTSENHGGRANSLTAPNPNAQSDLLINAWEKAGIDPTTVTYIEAHGTGTSLGDPIEINGLKKAFNHLYKKWDKESPKAPYCGLGSVKTNVGHLETAAGIAGILKVLLAMKHQQIPASIHFEEQNPYIDLSNSPFYIVDKTQEWRQLRDEKNQPIPRRAGISSFGFGGVNSHVVLEEYNNDAHSLMCQDTSPQMVVLSAKDEERLKDYSLLMVEYLRKVLHDDKIGLADIAHTLYVGREAMEERLAMVVNSKEELMEILQQFVEETSTATTYQGNTRNRKSRVLKEEITQEVIEKLVEEGDLDKICSLWVQGIDIDLRKVNKASLKRKVSLPTYPFAKERYWFTSEVLDSGSVGSAPKSLHPMIQENTSNLLEQKFTTELTGQEAFLAGHVVNGEKILPGVAYMEMARVAGDLSSGDSKQVTIIKEVLWEKPFSLNKEPRKIDIALYPQEDEVEYEVTSINKVGKRVIYSKGKILFENRDPSTFKYEKLNIIGIKGDCPHLKTREASYESFEKMGLQYGTDFRTLKELYYGGDHAISLLELSDGAKKHLQDYVINPFIMDGALQTVQGILGNSNESKDVLYLPYSLGEIEILRPLKESCYAYARKVKAKEDDHFATFDIQIADMEGNILIYVRGFRLRRVSQGSNSPEMTRDQVIDYFNLLKTGEMEIDDVYQKLRS